MRLRYLTLAVLTALSSPASHAGTVNYTTADTPVCTASQIARVDFVNQRQMGLDAKDPHGHYIGTSEGDGIAWRNWVPIDSYKHAMCGTLYDYDYFSYESWLVTEHDSNKYMFPGTGHTGMMLDPIQWGFTSSSDLHTCNGQLCMEAEIEHDQTYGSNPWFPRIVGAESPLTGKTLCMYGPWVADDGHGGRPEIHPSETMWWQVSDPFSPRFGFREHRVILTQDDSKRFDDPVGDFVPDLPSSIKAWAAGPRTAFVRQAFVLPLSGGAQDYMHVYEGATRLVTTSGDASLSSDATVGTQHTLAYNGEPKITVVEHQPDNNLGVVFDESTSIFNGNLYDVCRRSSGYLQGFVTLRSKFGSNVEDNAGYQELLIRHTSQLSDSIGLQAASPKASSVAPSIDALVKVARVDPQSLSVERIGTRAIVRGDLLVELRPGVALDTARDGSGKRIVLTKSAAKAHQKGEVVRLRNLDLAAEQSLELGFAPGDPRTVKLPGLALTADLLIAPQSSDAVQKDEKQLDSAWRDLLRKVDAENVERPGSFEHIGSWTADAIPIFAARKNGKASWEDAFEVAKLLNEAALGSRAGALDADIAATDLVWSSTGGNAAPSSASRWEYALAFQDASRLQDEKISLRLNDAFGGEVNKSHSVWSHVLRAEATALAEQLPDLIADLAGVARKTLEASATDPSLYSDDASTSPIALRHRVLQRLLLRTSRDGYVTPEELLVMVKLAREVAADRGKVLDANGI